MHPVISCEDFIDFFKSQRNDKHTKYCFIMGSGCSVENGIATGWALADKWYRELPDHYSGDEIANWKAVESINESDIGFYYSKIFKFRFANSPGAGYEAINFEIEKGKTGIGHIILLQLMIKTGSNVTITTNFDTLVEEALYTFTKVRPIICGHESIARYAHPSVNHPLIIKIHRDRFMEPFNLDEEIAELRPEWTKVLNQVFSTANRRSS